jgi:hypothetical protein
MAYITKDQVNAMREALKPVCKKYGMKVTLSGSNTSKVTATVVSGKIDLIESYIRISVRENVRYTSTASELADQIRDKKNVQVNHYYLNSQFDGVALEFLQAVYAVISQGHWDESDSMTDYFHCSFYRGIHIGKWNKGYVLTP